MTAQAMPAPGIDPKKLQDLTDFAASPALALAGIEMHEGADHALLVTAPLAPVSRPHGLVDPALLLVLLDTGLSAQLGITLDEGDACITGQLQVTFAPGVVTEGTQLRCQGRIIGRHEAVSTVVGQVHDDQAKMLAAGVVRVHTVGGQERSKPGPYQPVLIHDVPISDVLSLEVAEDEPGALTSRWTTLSATANRFGQVHGGFVIALSEAASRLVAQQGGRRVTPLDHVHRYYRPLLVLPGKIVRCEATIARAGRQVVTTSCRLLDEDGVLLGTSDSSYAVISETAGR